MTSCRGRSRILSNAPCACMSVFRSSTRSCRPRPNPPIRSRARSATRSTAWPPFSNRQAAEPNYLSQFETIALAGRIADPPVHYLGPGFSSQAWADLNRPASKSAVGMAEIPLGGNPVAYELLQRFDIRKSTVALSLPDDFITTGDLE